MNRINRNYLSMLNNSISSLAKSNMRSVKDYSFTNSKDKYQSARTINNGYSNIFIGYDRNGSDLSWNAGSDNLMCNIDRNNPNIKYVRNTITNAWTIYEQPKNLSKLVEDLLPHKLDILTAKDNVLDIKVGRHYKVKTRLNDYHEVSIDKNGYSNWLFNEVHPVADSTKVFSQTEAKEYNRTNHFIDCLSTIKDTEQMLSTINYFFTYDEVSEMMTNLGIESDAYFEIVGHSEPIYLDKTGITYKRSTVEKFRDAYNNKNWFEKGFTQDSKFIIDGREFKLDDSGHLNLPEGIIAIPTKVKIIK